MFISPFTFRAAASFSVCDLISSSTEGGRLYAGSTQAESPLWMPASSMCCITPPMMVRVPSLRQSTSTSVASSRNLSISTGLPGETSTARTNLMRMILRRKPKVYHYDPKLKETLMDLILHRFRNPTTGYWGESYVRDGNVEYRRRPQHDVPHC